MKNWNTAYHRMFVRFRDDLRAQRANGGRYRSDEQIDREAWRSAATAVESAIRREDEADAIAKRRQGIAA